MNERNLRFTIYDLRLGLASLLVVAAVSTTARAADWTMWGKSPTRNMVSDEKNPPTDWKVPHSEEDKGANILWSAALGSKSYGNPVVSEGVVYIGTNNEAKRNPAITADGGVLMAFDQKTGRFLWQRYSAKLPTGRVNDWPGEGICSTVYAEPGKIWYSTSRCEVVCLGVGPGDLTNGVPKELWVYDIIKELGVFPHNMTSCSIVAWGDLIYCITSNGVDDTHKHMPAPQAPSIVCLNKNTGKLVWTDNSPGINVLHGQWSSPAIAEVNGTPLVIAPLGDGWVYAYDARNGKIIWKFDCNLKDAVYPQTRNELISTPVIVDNKMFIATGQDPEHGEGTAIFWCVDITRTGDVSAELASDVEKAKPGQELLALREQVPSKGKPNPNSATVWKFDQYDKNKNGRIERSERMNRTISTAVVIDGLVFIPDFSGFLHCLDQKTGQVYWSHDMESAMWGSPLAVDGKIYLTDEGGNVRIFAISKEKKLLSPEDDHLNLGSSSYCSPVVVDGVMYLTSRERLFAIKTGAGGQ
jgi:outer membrane protein assembly factor BamB